MPTSRHPTRRAGPRPGQAAKSAAKTPLGGLGLLLFFTGQAAKSAAKTPLDCTTTTTKRIGRKKTRPAISRPPTLFAAVKLQPPPKNKPERFATESKCGKKTPQQGPQRGRRRKTLQRQAAGRKGGQKTAACRPKNRRRPCRKTLLAASAASTYRLCGPCCSVKPQNKKTRVRGA